MNVTVAMPSVLRRFRLAAQPLTRKGYHVRVIPVNTVAAAQSSKSMPSVQLPARRLQAHSLLQLLKVQQ